MMMHGLANFKFLFVSMATSTRYYLIWLRPCNCYTSQYAGTL